MRINLVRGRNTYLFTVLTCFLGPVFLFGLIPCHCVNSAFLFYACSVKESAQTSGEPLWECLSSRLFELTLPGRGRDTPDVSCCDCVWRGEIVSPNAIAARPKAVDNSVPGCWRGYGGRCVINNASTMVLDMGPALVRAMGGGRPAAGPRAPPLFARFVRRGAARSRPRVP